MSADNIEDRFNARRLRTLVEVGGAFCVPAALAQTEGLSFSIEYRRIPGRQFELVLWLGYPWAEPHVEAGEAWLELWLGAPMWVRFTLEARVLNRALFVPAEVRPALDPAQRPAGAWLLPSSRLPSDPGATP